MRWLATVLIVLAAIGCSPSDDAVTSDSGQKVNDHRAGAFDVCTQFVADELKAPGGADWRDPYGDQVKFIDHKTEVTVIASVDSENSFGAKLRTTYMCTVKPSGGDNWRLVDLQVPSPLPPPN